VLKFLVQCVKCSLLVGNLNVKNKKTSFFSHYYKVSLGVNDEKIVRMYWTNPLDMCHR
jgi:hypothetical protein